MITDYTFLGIETTATAKDIDYAYQKLTSKLVTDKASKAQITQASDSFKRLIGKKPHNEQLTILIKNLASIGSETNLYLWYDIEDNDVTQKCSFNRPFYAHGEIIKFCKQASSLLKTHLNQLEEHSDCILPCINATLMELQSLYQLEHYNVETSLSGYHFLEMINRLNYIFNEVRPELLTMNQRLYLNNHPQSEKDEVVPQPSTIPMLINKLRNNILLNIQVLARENSLSNVASHSAPITQSSSNKRKLLIADSYQHYGLLARKSKQKTSNNTTSTLKIDSAKI
jgi:hypothetical protein